MTFWGVEVKCGEVLDVEVRNLRLVNFTQVTLGERKNAMEMEGDVTLYATVDGKKFVLGHLHPERLPDQKTNFMFDRSFQISHNYENGIVYLSGIKTALDDYEYDDESDQDNEEFEECDEEVYRKKLIQKSMDDLGLPVKTEEYRKEKMEILRRQIELMEKDRYDKDLEFFFSPHDHMTGDHLEAVLVRKGQIAQVYGWPLID